MPPNSYDDDFIFRLRLPTSTTTLISVFQSLGALQKANAELKKTSRDTTEAMRKSISVQKAEIGRLGWELEEGRGELAHRKRTEKTLQAKDVTIHIIIGIPCANSIT